MRPIATALAVSTWFVAPAVAAENPTGVWMTEEKSSKIRIAPCGKLLCATILWAKDGGMDDQNPDPALRKRSMIGRALSRDIRPDGKGTWKGSMYNPENGKTYKTTLTPKGGELEVGGCVLGGLLCGSETWERTAEATASVGSK
jgi:uncharacterized protein (DUF2147 family)